MTQTLSEEQIRADERQKVLSKIATPNVSYKNEDVDRLVRWAFAHAPSQRLKPYDEYPYHGEPLNQLGYIVRSLGGQFDDSTDLPGEPSWALLDEPYIPLAGKDAGDSNPIEFDGIREEADPMTLLIHAGDKQDAALQNRPHKDRIDDLVTRADGATERLDIHMRQLKELRRDLSILFNNAGMHYPPNFDESISVPAETTARSAVDTAIQDVIAERLLQNEIWGEQNHEAPVWLTILTEEVGEAAQALLHDLHGGDHADTLRDELVHVAAVTVQWIQCIDRHSDVAISEDPH
jgi:NTP pyrophosphatase (non-canonical NTP hydrolase)